MPHTPESVDLQASAARVSRAASAPLVSTDNKTHWVAASMWECTRIARVSSPEEELKARSTTQRPVPAEVAAYAATSLSTAEL